MKNSPDKFPLKISTKLKEKLCLTAWQAREQAYAPYSGFKVGAAILTFEGKIYSGCNIENSSYGLSICAERVALATAVAAGERNFKAICLAAQSSEQLIPCGACLQVLAEFAMNLILISPEPGYISQEYHLNEIFPIPFGFSKPFS